MILFVGNSQGSPLHSSPQPRSQEKKETERTHLDKPGSPQTVSKAIERLKQAVNGNSVVKNQCSVQGRTIEVEESSNVVESTGCALVVTTTKKTSTGNGSLRFTLRVNLADLTMPVSVEPLNTAGCKPERGTLIQVTSRSKPGKTIQTSRISSDIQKTDNQPAEGKEATFRKSLTLFFPDTESAKRAARALERAVAVCGGEEWPDEDDLP